MGALVAGAAVAVTLIVVTTDGGSTSNVAAIGLPSAGPSANDCGTVSQRPATVSEAAVVSHLSAQLPSGYSLSSATPPEAIVQARAAANIDCWTADVTYVDNASHRLLAVTVSRQGDEPRSSCAVPDGYLPVTCTTVAGRPASVAHGGSRSTIGWVSEADNFTYLSGYGFSDDELLSIANSVVFDGTRVSVDAPAGMTEIDNTPKTNSDDRSVTYYTATFAREGDSTGSAALTVTITTWNDTIVNEVGPATTLDIAGATAIVVTTGGPGSGIIDWTNTLRSSDPNAAMAIEAPSHSYATWTADGITYRVEGPDPATVAQLAQTVPPSKP